MKYKKTKIKKTGLMTIQSPADPKVNIVIASELQDDNMIEKEMMGEILPYYVYKFPLNGKDVYGLSVLGVRETSRRLARKQNSGYKIRINPSSLQIERNVEYNGKMGVEVRVMAENLVDGQTAFGIKFETYQKTGRNGLYENTFAVEKAISKAERNAVRKLIPETMALTMIKKLIGENKNNVQTIAPADVAKVPVLKTIQEGNTNQFQEAIKMIRTQKSKDKLVEWRQKINASNKYSATEKQLLNREITKKIGI